MFWYSDKSYQKFFEKAAEEYYEDTGIVVDVEYQDSMDYMDAGRNISGYLHDRKR